MAGWGKSNPTVRAEGDEPIRVDKSIELNWIAVKRLLEKLSRVYVVALRKNNNNLHFKTTTGFC